MGGQHRWAPAFLAACHHIYFIIYSTICIFLLWLIKLLLLLASSPQSFTVVIHSKFTLILLFVLIT